MNNLISMCFAVYAIESWLVGKIKHIGIIFAGLMVYDVYFVFASDVMLTVAKGMDLPLKILLPIDTNFQNFAMIGLGDIIIPGLLSSMCIRCDLINSFKFGKEKA
jgi:minor histocompatibility antigen H13